MTSAALAQSAGAAGTTAYLCKVPTGGDEVVGPKFSDSHCAVVDETNGTIRHVKIPKESVGVDLTLEPEPFILGANIAGLEVEIYALGASASGTLENDESGGEMFASGSTSKVVLEEVFVFNRPCEIAGIPGGTGKIESAAIKVTTAGQGDGLKFEPQMGTKLAEFELFGAKCPAGLKGKYPVLGSVTTFAITGSTTRFKMLNITAAETLRLKTATGPVAGFSGVFSVSTAGGGLPISPTT